MRQFLFIWCLILIPSSLLAQATECPLYASKQDCLSAVEERYQNMLDFFDDTYNQEGPDMLRRPGMVLVMNDVRDYERKACNKTCLN